MPANGLVNEHNEQLIGRLYNWKFNQALKYIEGESQDVQNKVKYLAQEYGDVGWVFKSNLAKKISMNVEVLIGDVV